MMRYVQHSPIVVTPEKIYPNEARALFALVENGAEIIHLRKPQAVGAEFREYLLNIHPEILYHLTIHGHPELAGFFGLGGVHLKRESLVRVSGSFRRSASCHDWMEVKSLMGHADYVFLSPVFDSISKTGYRSAFGEEQLKVLLADPDRPVTVALGGITAGNIGDARRWGFEGAACLGSVWAFRGGEIDIKRSVAHYVEIKKAWNGAK